MQRVSVVGTSGSGKTRLAKLIAARLGATHLELDSIFHLPGWGELPLDEFRARVAEVTAGDRWVIDGNYPAVTDLIWTRADTVVWLDLPRRTVMRQLLPRTVARVVRRTELWNGNRESWRDVLSRDPQRSILLWAWTRHGTYANRFEPAMRDPANAHLTWVRLRSRKQIADFLTRLT